MAYTTQSFNYTPMTREQFSSAPAYSASSSASAMGQFQPSQEFMDFSRWLAQQGMDMFNLARADRNTQLQVANAFQQQQADRANALQQQQISNAQNQQAFQNQMLQQQYGDQRMSQANADLDRQRALWDAQQQNMLAFGNAQTANNPVIQVRGTLPQYTTDGREIIFGSGNFGPTQARAGLLAAASR